jgi:hypothetical protein
MKIENLKAGQVLKNYKELCEVLDIEPTSKANNSRIAQFKELSRYCKYHKEGHTIIIDELYSKELEKVDNRSNNKGGNNVKYADDMEYLILRLLNKFEISKDERVGFSKNMLFSHCGLINENYRLVKGNTLKFSQMIDMPVQTINECFDYTNNRMLKTLQSTLNRMQRQALITWSNGYNIVLKDDKGQEYLEIATIEDEKVIMSIERNIMLTMGYTNKRLIFTGGQWNTFKEKATKQLKEIYPDIEYYYDNISFNYNNEDVAKALSEYEKIDKKQVKQEVNSKFSKSLDGTIDRRHKKAKENTPFGNSFEIIENYRKSEVFPQEQKYLKNTLINNDSPKVVLNKDYDKTKVKYLQKTFFERYNPSNTEQITFNDCDIAEDNIPF